MRNFKFRAWDIENKNMLYDFLWTLSPMNEVEMEGGSIIYWQSGHRYPVKGNTLDFEIMQFTGMFDKNNKEIYEGDFVSSIVKLKKFEPSTAIQKVIYERNKFQLSPSLWRSLDDLSSEYTREVIGNVFENPEKEVL